MPNDVKTVKDVSGHYQAYLDDAHIVSGSAVYGKYLDGTYLIPLGTITVQETKAPAGFTVEGAAVSSAETGAALSGTNGVYLFNLVDENAAVYLKSGNALSTELSNETAATIRCAEVQNKGGIKVQKNDAATGSSTPSGDADLSGIRFAIINNTGSTITNKDGKQIANGAVVQVITTNAAGYAATGAADLPVGTYTVKELRADASVDSSGNLTEGTSALANSSYLWTDNSKSVTVHDTDTGKLVDAGACSDAPVTAVPVLEKYDLELNKQAAMGGTTLAGITFEIANQSANAVVVDGTSYAPGEVVATAVSDANGGIAFAAELPCGTYSVKEVQANASYTLTDGSAKTFTVKGENGTGVVVYEGGTSALIFKDRVVRGDLSFIKKDASNDQALAYVPFKITNNATGETHYILTGADGSYSSKTAVNTKNTNGNDAVLSAYGDTDIIPQSVINGLQKDAGLWFGGTSANDSYGALPYGTYTVTELKTEATKSMYMVSTTVTIDTDGKTVDLGTVYNIAVGLKTTLTDANGEHFIEAASSVTLVDRVAYQNLVLGTNYTLTGTLYVKDGSALSEICSEQVDFTPAAADGTVDVTFTFDASALAGKSVVAFEELTQDGVFCAEHKDPDDEGQTVRFPGIHTTAIGADTKDHVTGAEEITIVDTVSYTELEAGREYTVKGILMDKATGEAILVDGKEVISETTFTPETTDGTVDVTFNFDGSGLEDTIIVVFETLYTQGKEVAVHADIEDEDQSVYVPDIHTTAKDKVTEIGHTEAKPQATIIDTVLYSSLLPGKEYTVTGKLMDKATGKEILIGGKPVTAATTFTPAAASGSVDVVFTFDASAIEGTTVVAFESLDYKGIEVAVHADIEDEDQTVYIPKIRTTAISEDTKDHVTKADETITLVDTVKFTGLEVGREYTLKGVLMDKATGEAILVDGKEVASETAFTPETTDGTVDVTFTFDGTGLEDTIIVVFETLYTEGKEVAVHADIEDEDQSVYVPEIHTDAKDAVTEIDHTEALAQAAIIDTVTYSHLLPGREYTMTGTLMNKATGEPVLIDGEKVTASTTFTAEAAEGSVEIVFTFDASAIAGTTVVAFESCTYEGVEVAVHADIEDEDQTVYIPDVHTTATAADTEDHVTGANETVTITDEVALTGLKVGSEYTVKGILMDKATGKELVIEGKTVVSEAVFTAEQSDMTVTLTYELDASALAGTTTVVFETLYTEEKEVGRHTDITDEDQTVYIPEIHTTAADKETQINHTEAKEEAVIIDTVLYSHLLPGKEYTVTGTLMNKAAGEPILIDGEKVTASTTFTAETSEGSVDVVFTFDASAIAGTTVVAFETLDYKGIEIAVHADIEDEDQTVYIPEIGTTALAEDTDDHIEKAKEEAVIVDTVSYSGLEVGRAYKLTGTLMDQETGEPLLINDEEVTESVTFTAEKASGSVEITFTFDASALAGKTLVVFETLYTEEKEVAVHADIEDEGQSIHVPEICTTATDKETGDHDGVVAESTTVVDEVFYTNLIPGKEYTVTGKLMVKETGEPLVVDGEEVTATKIFTAEEADGSVILEFTFSSLALAGKHVVAFEDLAYEGISVATHADIEDEDQTVSYPSIHTTVFDQAGASKTMSLGSSVVLADTVTYTGLTAGKTYVLKGTVVDKATGASIGVTGETTFTAEKADGSVEVVFVLNTEALQGKTLVVFEALYDTNGVLIAGHSDLTDEDQTVTVPVKPEIPPVVTGDDSTPLPYILALALTLLAALAVVLVLAHRRKAR